MAKGGNGRGGGKSGSQLGRQSGQAGRGVLPGSHLTGQPGGKNRPPTTGTKLGSGRSDTDTGMNNPGGPRVAPRVGHIMGGADPQSHGANS